MNGSDTRARLEALRDRLQEHFGVGYWPVEPARPPAYSHAEPLYRAMASQPWNYYSMATCERTVPNVETHLDCFLLLELLSPCDPNGLKPHVQEALELVAVLAGLHRVRTRQGARWVEDSTAQEIGRALIPETEISIKPGGVLPEAEVIAEQCEFVKGNDAVLLYLRGLNLAKGSLVVLEGRPPVPFVPAHARDQGRAEIYAIDGRGEPLELACVHFLNTDAADFERRCPSGVDPEHQDWLEQWEADGVQLIETKIGVERCLALADGMAPLSDYAEVHKVWGRLRG